MTKTNDNQAKLAINVAMPASTEKKQPALRVYQFDTAGRLIQSVPASPKVELAIDPQRDYRITVGPDLMKNEKAPADIADQLLRSSAVSMDYRAISRVDSLGFNLSQTLVNQWFLDCVNIHGSVRKLLNPGETPVNYAPICTGTVQVFTIDLACSLGRMGAAFLATLKSQILANLVGMELIDIATFNLADFVRLSSLAAGMYPLSGNALRNYIYANRAQLAPFMCNIIPEGYICYRQLPDAQIQSDGTFSLEYCFFFWEARPDVYFEVVQTADGVTREIADPDIICTTMWSYDGSQPAVITVTDPAAIACQPNGHTGPDTTYVWPTAIGNVDLSEIDGILTMAGTGLLPGSASTGPIPWGGTLPLQMEFSPDLPNAAVKYYRWSYQFAGDSGFTQIHAPVTHRYQVVSIGPGGVINIHLIAKTLGPNLVNATTNLFEIPDPNVHWVDINDPADRPFAYFDSTDGQTPGRTGLVTLKLEMFDPAGVRVPVTSGSYQYILPDPGGVPGSYTMAVSPNVTPAGDLEYKVFVDNKKTNAQFFGVTASGHSADACGILHYTAVSDAVDIRYAATQPSNHLTWNLSVTKGTSGWVAGTGGSTSSPNPADFVNAASALLGTCRQGAFAVNLNTYATATDGYSRQSEYDDSATIAFALLTP